MTSFYQQSKEDTISHLKSSMQGLNTNDVEALQKQFGANELQEAKQKTKLAILFDQFADMMILILVVAAVISFVLGEHTDAYVIIAIVIANAWMGYAQESKAEESVRMLKKMAAQFATAIRNNNPEKIEARLLVPGDIILLEAGDIVPADARLIELSALKVDESSLTGESHSIEKITEPVAGENLVPGDQLNMIFKGTIVNNGTAKAIVTATGMDTELGKIAEMMDTGSQKTPLQKRLITFSKQLAVIVIIICAFVFGFGLMRGEAAFQMFLTALSLAVAALPEALPAVITIALAKGAGRMVKQKALVRKLPAVETLGSVTYICTDKTGTLTQNVMTVENVEVEESNKHLFHHAMMLTNDVRFSAENKLLGDSTETALVKYVLKEGLKKEDSENHFPILGKLPFDSERMRMSSFHQHENKWILFTKGAPARMVEIFSGKYGKEKIDELLHQNRSWAAEGLRVLFFGYKIFDEKPGNIDNSLEKDLEFLGIVAMIDPPREEVTEAILQCRTAGIKTVMITGDQALTAKAIAERLNIIKEEGEVKTGGDLEKLSEEELIKAVKNIAVYARVSPGQKLNIVKALQSNGEFVAMTGDGVNDAPSLKQADIGLAMGITGTDVTREAADMILLDDNFATIVRAVKEGRRIYENIRKFILYVLSCNLSEVLTVFLAPLLGFGMPLLPIHILWINLVTDGLPGIALVSEASEKDIMQQPPRPPKENLFAGGLLNRIILSAIVMTIAALVILYWGEKQGYNLRTQQTMVFTTLCFVQLCHALSVRSFFHLMFSARIFSNWWMWVAILITLSLQFLILYVPSLQGIFKTETLGMSQMLFIGIVTLASFICFELMKLLFKRKPVWK